LITVGEQNDIFSDATFLTFYSAMAWLKSKLSSWIFLSKSQASAYCQAWRLFQENKVDPRVTSSLPPFHANERCVTSLTGLHHVPGFTLLISFVY